MTATATNYDRVHKARKTAPLLESDDIARMKAAVKALEKERDKLHRELVDAGAAKEEARRDLQKCTTEPLVRVFRDLEAGRVKDAKATLERVLDGLDNAWSSLG